ncbi:MAG: 4-hydroxy-3-methylbut-2-enyl diphosphate reductase [Flavobacteriales bacterium]|jgi:4-hydroxy-3-methylbut-2-enyl diphosphate reductase
MKKFSIPDKFRSSAISQVKDWRRINDPRKQDFSPTTLDFGAVSFLIPRHMGFCYGVENAIEKSYKAISENPGKRIFLLSQMIHNPAVNADLESMGLRFIMDTEGHHFVQWDEINADDVVIIPAFGTTVEIEQLLQSKGVEVAKYNTTCPFVEKVWKRSAEIGKSGYSIIIHGKYKHEETRATFSHSQQNAPSVIVRDMKEAEALAKYMAPDASQAAFEQEFKGKYSPGFSIHKDLKHVGVVNQTTMLATETQEIADYFKSIITAAFGAEYFADTRDTLCYATNDNQDATLGVLQQGADFAIVVGGYNSSNTAQLAGILEREMPVFFIRDESEIIDAEHIQHFDYPNQQLKTTAGWIPSGKKPKVIITSGASCPDTVVEAVLQKVLSFFPDAIPLEKAIEALQA